MRYAILADIHSNLAALAAVLDDIKKWGGADELWSLGDLVDYGPDPSECIELLRRQKHTCIAGNHDLAAIGKIDLAHFSADAVASNRWTQRKITPDDVEFLDGLPPALKKGDFTLVHGSPRDPVWEYILSSESAAENFQCFDTQFCLVGHSHLPLAFREENGAGACVPWPKDGRITPGDKRMIINPGSVGQPRDGDPRASYAVLDNESNVITLHRVSYDIGSTRRKMAENNLPRALIERLEYGY